MLHFFKQKRRVQIRNRPFSTEWRWILERQFYIYSRLNEKDRQELDGHIQILLAEKNFEGCAGQVITDEVRLLVAAQACLLLLHREDDCYRNLRSILIYPSTFVVRQASSERWEDTDCSQRALSGLASPNGAVILAWDVAQRDAGMMNGGRNLVIHEFAHQLDFEDGFFNGVPALAGKPFKEGPQRLKQWAEAFSKEFVELSHASSKGEETLLSTYGTINAGEFFAVASECFFTKPWELKKRHAELYSQLKDFFRQDPTDYFPDPTAPKWSLV